jgi:hypothetical protein
MPLTLKIMLNSNKYKKYVGPNVSDRKLCGPAAAMHAVKASMKSSGG